MTCLTALNLPCRCFVAAMLLSASITNAQQPLTRTVEVSGEASLTRPPNLAVIQMLLSTQGETAREATREFKRVRQAFADQMGPMNYPSVTLKFQQPKLVSSVSDQMMAMMQDPFGEGGNNEPAPQFECREVVLLEMEVDEKTEPMLEQLAEIVDASLDADAKLPQQSLEMMFGGATESGETLVTLSRTDLAELQEQVTAKAFSDARAKAESLATLAGGQLGDVIEITGHSQEEVFGFNYSIEAEISANVTITGYLTVRFELKN